MTPKIKICGITSVHDAELALECEADYLGVIFADSPRRVAIETAKEISKMATPLVGVFQNQPLSFVQEVLAEVKLDFVQLHGEESPEYCQTLPLPVIKVFTAHYPLDWDRIGPYQQVDFLMLDKPHDYLEQAITFFKEERDQLPPVFLAGGLNAENVSMFIQSAQPYAVDVASGVESEPGIKDPQKLQAFCQAVQRL